MKLEKDLKHQTEAVKSIGNVFEDVNVEKSDSITENPKIDLSSSNIKENIEKIQESNNIPKEMRKYVGIQDDYLNIDIKMETGTGKTFVQIKTIYELNRLYGFTKFIIVVPSLAIKSGTKQFILSNDTKQFFKDEYNGMEIQLDLVEKISSKSGKKARNYFPEAVREFVTSPAVNTKKIQVMLINSALITNGKMLTKDYDTTIINEITNPSKAIQSVNPILIIDEPHKFSNDKKTFNNIMEKFKPQCVIRFGATFPDKTKKEKKEKDYKNLIYNLGSIDAFNQNLVKGVKGECVPAGSNSDVLIKLISIKSKEKCVIQRIETDNKKSFDLSKNDSLSIVHEDFDGVIITGITKNSVILSNGVEVKQGEELSPDSYSISYQDNMLEVALDRHFETERKNFKSGIKTLALFFIDDIASYRKNGDQDPYLLNSFEEMLKEKLKEEIDHTEDSEYKDYLIASLNDIKACHAGYFSQDNIEKDDDIINEVNDILNDKEKILKVKDENGRFNLRRFIFSKWTLKEGWDNPNIFTIAKLRSSGSETSKLQEVGRGLRLPVDNNLNRLSRLNNEPFYLNYIVDFTEKDFIKELTEEINNDTKKIDRVNDGLNRGKVIEREDEKKNNIKVRKNQYNQIKKLWELLNEKYIINYEKIDDEEIEEALVNILNEEIGSQDIITTERYSLNVSDDKANTMQESGISLSTNKTLKYNEFLIRLSESTDIPIINIHKALVKYNEEHKLDNTFFNNTTLNNFYIKIKEWKMNVLFERFTYKKTDLPIHPTALTLEDGSVSDSIVLGNIGTIKEEGAPQEKYLYDTIAYDSSIERDDIMEEIDGVTVFGKIPKSSIRIPLPNGETYSPDFMYLVEKKDGSTELNVIIESKNVEMDKSLRQTEKYRIDCAEKFFKQLENEGINVKYRRQLNNKKVATIIGELV